MSKVIHGLILIATFVVTVVIVLLIYRPDIVTKWWLWAIGMSATVVAWTKAIIERIKGFINDIIKSEELKKSKQPQQ